MPTLMNIRPIIYTGILCIVLTGCAAPPTDTQAPKPTPSSVTIEPFVEGIEIPWGISFLPSGDLLVTERTGSLLWISEGSQQRYTIGGVEHRGEGGLLGITLHPDFENNSLLYLYLTTEEEGDIRNRVERYRYAGNQLTERTVILDGIPGARYHDGGRLAFGPDGLLYITTGDAGNEDAAQDTTSLAGKILRIHDDGTLPEDNPFGNAVYSYGHRNPQGLTWDDAGQLWSTEHGRSGLRSGYDELNRIERGGNYGWPVIQGSQTQDGMIPPVAHSGPSTTWAPASAAYVDGRVFFGGLRGESLYAADITVSPPTITAHFGGKYGRLRDVTLGPDGYLYVSSSNRDGRGNPAPEDDRILRIDPDALL